MIRHLVQKESEIVGGTPLSEEAVKQTSQGVLSLITSDPLLLAVIIIAVIIVAYLLYSYLVK